MGVTKVHDFSSLHSKNGKTICISKQIHLCHFNWKIFHMIEKNLFKLFILYKEFPPPFFVEKVLLSFGRLCQKGSPSKIAAKRIQDDKARRVMTLDF